MLSAIQIQTKIHIDKDNDKDKDKDADRIDGTLLVCYILGILMTQAFQV